MSLFDEPIFNEPTPTTGAAESWTSAAIPSTGSSSRIASGLSRAADGYGTGARQAAGDITIEIEALEWGTERLS